MNRHTAIMIGALTLFAATASCSSLLGDFTGSSATANDGGQDDASTAGDGQSEGGPFASDSGTDADVTTSSGYDASDADSSRAVDSSPGTDGAPNCPAGQTSCAGTCTDTAGDIRNCGQCQHDCNALAHVTGVGITCAAGHCSVPPTSCAAGYMHCSSIPDDGCEADVTKPNRCGDCSTMCSAAAPVCTPTNTTPVDIKYACATGCSGMTPALCTGTCTNVMSDPSNCAACGKKCPVPTGSGNATCTAGACTIACSIGYHVCNAIDCADDKSPNSCGSSCVPCAIPNAAAGCTVGACTISSCNAGYGNCDGILANGCETNILTSSAHCGMCGFACDGVCQGGKCLTPTSLSSLALWLDAQVGVTLSGGNVTKWADRTKYHNDAIQYSLVNSPALGGLGNQKAISFDDRNTSELRIPDSNTLQWSTGDFLIELVVQYNHDANFRDLLIGKTLSTSPFTGPAIFVNDPPDGSGRIRAYLDSSTYVTSAVGGYMGSVAHIIGMHRAGTVVELRIDGAKSNSATFLSPVDVSAPAQLTYLGGHYPNGTYADGYYGAIAEVVAAGAPITSTDIATVEAYFKGKYGL